MMDIFFVYDPINKTHFFYIFQVCLTSNTNTDLLITLFQDTSNTTLATLNVLTHLKQKYSKREINHIFLSGNFSRGLAIDQASRSRYVKSDDILLFIDVDILFTATTLDRIRKNTIQHQQVYLPIVFSEYNPKRIDTDFDIGASSAQQMAGSGGSVVTSSIYNAFKNPLNTDYQQSYSVYHKHLQQLHIDNENGYFRQFGYGIVAIYKSDILHPDIDGFITDIKGWGLEDVRFLEKIITSNHKPNQKILDIADGKDDNRIFHGDTNSNNLNSHVTLSIFRSADTSLVHIYHPINCDKNLEEAQHKMCLGTLGNTLGNHKLLENYFIRNKFMIDYVKSSRTSNNNNNDERTL
jgi:chondroitin sulfate synthase